jgi:oligoendopeptidase F
MVISLPHPHTHAILFAYAAKQTLCLLPHAGLFNMLSDNSHEIRQQADAALSEFLQEIKNSPVSLWSSLEQAVYL